MNNIDIKFDDTKKSKKFLNEGLEKYNYSKNKYLNPNIYEKDRKYFGFYAYEDDILIGGVFGWIDYENWTWIDLLYIDEQFRRRDIGTKLINSVENFTKENNCIGIITETWNFQARGFYEKMGFVVYGQLEDHPIGAIDYKLKKNRK